MSNTDELPTPFDGYEVHGVREFGRGAKRHCEQVPDEDARFWSLYGHIPGQGLECIGDFKNRALAEEVRARIKGRQPALQEALAWLATAAEDLDVALDETPGQFAAERMELAAACRNARDALRTGSRIDVHQLLRARRQVAVIWSIEDVQGVRPELTDDQAWDVLERCYDKHDCEWGFTWNYLEDVADIMFPEQPSTTKE
ncbi:MAG TPA: hypothetical protein VMV10_27590 [Pirellulales bacterium]|nr:hypothetical protein [Pirellulales bacterium]